MTRIEALREAIRDEENRRRLYSADQVGLRPLKGAEKEHERACEIISGLKEICQAMQSEIVRRSIAVWQEDLMTDADAVKRQMEDMIRQGREA